MANSQDGGGKSSRMMEVIRFVVTGGVCFLIEFAVLVLLHDKAGLDTLIATPIAFLVSVIVNYLLCVKWVFPGAGEQGNVQRTGFLVTSLMGLGLNELFMWLLRLAFGETAAVMQVFSFTVTMYMVNKVISTVLVMIWNYFTKRWILNKGKHDG